MYKKTKFRVQLKTNSKEHPMNKVEFCKILEEECLNSNNISFSVTSAKGLITLFACVTFRLKTNLEAFNEHYEEINWANMKLNQLAEKYKKTHFHTKLLTDTDAAYFDKVFAVTKQPPVKKGRETDTQSMGSFIQFNYPKD